MTEYNNNGSTRYFAYDYEGRMTGVSGAYSASYTYNGLDTRVSKTENSVSNTYSRDGVGVTSPVLNDGDAAYTPGVSERRSSTTTFMHSGLKNAEAQTGTGQTIGQSRTYDAFGNATASSGTWKGPFGYAGEFGYQEDATGLKLLGHRYYDPSLGRFLTRDPIQDGRNWYAYCENNPVASIDPGGLFRYQLLREFIENGARIFKPVRDVTKRAARRARAKGKIILVSGENAGREAGEIDNSISGGTSYHHDPHETHADGTPVVNPRSHWQNDKVPGHTFYAGVFFLIAVLTLDPIGIGQGAAEYCDENDEGWRDHVERWYSGRGGFADENIFSDDFLSGA